MPVFPAMLWRYTAAAVPVPRCTTCCRQYVTTAFCALVRTDVAEGEGQGSDDPLDVVTLVITCGEMWVPPSAKVE